MTVDAYFLLGVSPPVFSCTFGASFGSCPVKLGVGFSMLSTDVEF